MLRRVFSVFILTILAVVLSGCLAGPSPLRRKVDDLQNKNYEVNPLATSVFSTVPVYGMMMLSGIFIDSFVINPIQFWGHDVWVGSGTAHTHDNPEGVVGIWPWLEAGPVDNSETLSGSP